MCVAMKSSFPEFEKVRWEVAHERSECKPDRAEQSKRDLAGSANRWRNAEETDSRKDDSHSPAHHLVLLRRHDAVPVFGSSRHRHPPSSLLPPHGGIRL